MAESTWLPHAQDHAPHGAAALGVTAENQCSAFLGIFKSRIYGERATGCCVSCARQRLEL